MLLSVGACGDNIAGLTLDEMQGARRAAECERLVRCGLFSVQETCASYFRAAVDVSLEPSVDGGKIRYDPVAAAACNRALAKRSCDLTASDGREVPAICNTVLVGLVPAGGTCAADRECGTNRCDAKLCGRDQCCVGGCESYVAPAAVGTPCIERVGCVDGAFCGRDAQCHALSAATKACDLDTDCEPGLGCIGSTELEAGACRPLPHLGEACPYLRCAEIGARCDNLTCVEYGLAGDACVSSAECSEFRVCDSATHHCIDKPTLGMSCDESCAGESWCDFNGGVPPGICRAPQPIGVPCFASDECASRYCQEGPIFDQCATPVVCL